MALIKDGQNEAQNIVQEAFLKAHQKLDQFRETARFSSWLIRIAWNESFVKVLKLRGISKVFGQDLPDEMEELSSDLIGWVPNPEQLRSASELRDVLRKGLSELNPHLRMVFVMRDLAELSLNETAEMLQLTPAAVKARLLRARLQLRETLNHHFRERKRPARQVGWDSGPMSSPLTH